jgi:hypothetical protein
MHKYFHITKETKIHCKRVGNVINIEKEYLDSPTFPFGIMKGIY